MKNICYNKSYYDCYVNIQGFVAGADGLYDVQYDIFCKNQQIWSNYKSSNKHVIECMQQGMNFTEKELDETVKRFVEDFDQGPVSLHCNLYISLCIAGSDGLSKEEIDRFYLVSNKFGLTKEKADKILDTYLAECRLMKAFDEEIYPNVHYEPS